MFAKMTRFSLALVIGSTALLLAQEAFASFGGLQGRVRFHNKNAGYCPVGEDCTGARYTESLYDSRIGIPEAEVQVLDASTYAVLGSGVTDKDGNYFMFWYKPGSASNVSVRLRVRYRHKDGRFYFHSVNNHNQLTSTSSSLTASNGVVTPVNWYWGTSSAPNSVANAYWAAWMLWDKSLRFSNRMKTYFTDVDIMAFDVGNVTGCNAIGSCARGWFRDMSPENVPSWAENKSTVVLDSSASTPYQPQARVMHEMGHVADFMSGPNSYMRRSTGTGYAGSSGWSENTREYRATALTEGIATFMATSAFYKDFARDPRTCRGNGNGSAGQGHCYPGSGSTVTNWDLEQSNHGSCSFEEGRWPVSAMRFFWDIYDEVDDGIDTIDLSLYNILDSLAAFPCPNFPSCFSNGQLFDQYTSVNISNGTRSISVGEEDENNAWDFRKNMLNEYSGGYDVRDEYFNNCMGFF